MKKKILFVAYSICGGGSERRLASILRELDREKFEPHLCVFSLTGGEKDALPADVPLHPLPAALRPASLSLIWQLYRLILGLKPDKVFSVLWGVNVIAAAAAKLAGVPAVLNEATTPSESVKRLPLPFLRKKMISFFYRRAERIITVSEFAKADLVNVFGVPAEKITTIHNGVRVAEIGIAAREYDPGATGFVLGCGGLNWWKNYSLAIKALAGGAGPALIILGKGPLKERLQKEAAEAGVELSLPGHKENPYPYFRQAAVLILTSRYEGFPNVLLEAMACGTPVISVDCPGGIREIIEDGVTGLLVPQDDPVALYAAIKRVTGSAAFSGWLAAGARARLKERFLFKRMLASYERLL